MKLFKTPNEFQNFLRLFSNQVTNNFLKYKIKRMDSHSNEYDFIKDLTQAEANSILEKRKSSYQHHQTLTIVEDNEANELDQTINYRR